MTTKTLPATVAQAISDMHMPLSNESYLPMHYKSLPEMAKIRSDAPDIPDFVRDVVGTIAIISGDHGPTSAQEYLARCAAALIILGHGGTDEAHDLVSPLSWPNELPFAYGPPVAVDEQVLTLASYVHALVHRREGPFPSEFGMTGFSNADYWAGSALRSPEGAEALPLDEIRSSVVALAAARQDDPNVQIWIKQNVTGEEHAFPVWDPRVLNELCCTLQAAQKDPKPGQELPSPAFVDFAEQAVLSEMKILLKHTLKAIGYDV